MNSEVLPSGILENFSPVAREVQGTQEVQYVINNNSQGRCVLFLEKINFSNAYLPIYEVLDAHNIGLPSQV